MSPLPPDGQPWPLQGHADRYDRMREGSAWYAGNPAGIAGTADTSAQTRGTSVGTTVNPGTGRRVLNALRPSFWATGPAEGELDSRRHLPVFNDICTLSSEWLFSESLSVRVVGPTYEEDAAEVDGRRAYRKGDPRPETAAAQERLDWLLERTNWEALLLAAGETAPALGSVGLRIAYDKTVLPDRPVITRQDADSVLPLYSWGQLVGVIFWRPVQVEDSGKILRHLELHEGGKIYHGLYRGDSTTLGDRVSLKTHLSTENLTDNPDGLTFTLGTGAPTATSIPNMLPDPQDRASQVGRSDFTPPVFDLLSAIDEVYSQMMEEMRDARGKILLPQSMLKQGRPGEGQSFDPNQKYYTGLNVPPGEKEGGLEGGVKVVQFAMRIDQYLALLRALIVMAIRSAGYNPDADGSETGPEITATEYRGKRARSMSTRDKKMRYWRGELGNLLTAYLALDVQEFTPRGTKADGWKGGQPIKAFPVEVTFPDAVQPSQMELAETAKALKEAGATMLEVQRAIHPDWSETRLQTEVDTALREVSVIDPVTFGATDGGLGI